MNLADIIIFGLLTACVVFVIIRIIKQKKKGQRTCGRCSGCGMRENCTQEKKK